MEKLIIQAGTDSGVVAYTDLSVPDDYTMSQVVRAVRNADWDYFRICDTMQAFVRVSGNPTNP